MATTVAFGTYPTRRAERDVAKRRSWTIAVWSIAVGVLVLVVAGIAFQAMGGHWFIVETPSMGQTAPIGTLVLDSKTAFASLHVGEIITFHPPTQPSETYTHRIVAITAKGISTRGDINGAADPWMLHSRDLVGRVTTILPGIGWLIKALPYLLIGGVIIWAVTMPLRSPTSRAAWRISGLAFVAALAAYILKPFVGVIVLATTSERHSASATLVSSGLLPIRVSAYHGTSVSLASGQVGSVSVPSLVRDGHYVLSSALDLPWYGWVIFIVLCLTPLLWVLFVGLPPDPERELRR